MSISTISNLVGGGGGQNAGGILSVGMDFAATAALMPVLGPLAPIVGPLVSKLAKGVLGSLVKGVAGLFNKKSRNAAAYTEAQRPYLNMLNTMGNTYKTNNNTQKFNSTADLFDKLDYAVAQRHNAIRSGNNNMQFQAEMEINSIQKEISKRFKAEFPNATRHNYFT